MLKQRSKPHLNPQTLLYRLRPKLTPGVLLRNLNEPGASGNPNRNAIQSGSQRENEACSVAPRISRRGIVDQDGQEPMRKENI